MIFIPYLRYTANLVFTLAAMIVTSITLATPALASMSDEMDEAEAFAIGYQAFVVGAVYARSQILMEKDIHPEAALNAPLNHFNVYPGLAKPGAIDFTPNNDTVYGLAWLDLRQGPVLITIPEVKGRYYTIQATDWALNTFSYIGSRVNSKAGTYAYVPPGWSGSLPQGVERIEATTTGIFLQARTVVQPENADDIEPVVAQLKTYRLEPLNKNATYMAADPSSPVPNPKLDNPVWKSLDFFTLLNRAWDFGGVRAQDKEIVGMFASLGIGPGLTFDPATLNEAQQRGLLRGVQAGFDRVVSHKMEIGEDRNGWRYATNLGRYGSNRLLASAAGMTGYGANAAEEALYIPVFTDGTGENLDGSHRYRIHFDADNLPPAEAFWSVTIYSLPENQLIDNPIDRYAFGDRTPSLKRWLDGSIDIYVQNDRPEGDAAANWLPSPKGPFWMILRMYQPAPEALSGGYMPPPVERME
mgnify:CR=1 FL=1